MPHLPGDLPAIHASLTTDIERVHARRGRCALCDGRGFWVRLLPEPWMPLTEWCPECGGTGRDPKEDDAA